MDALYWLVDKKKKKSDVLIRIQHQDQLVLFLKTLRDPDLTKEFGGRDEVETTKEEKRGVFSWK